MIPILWDGILFGYMINSIQSKLAAIDLSLPNTDVPINILIFIDLPSTLIDSFDEVDNAENSFALL